MATDAVKIPFTEAAAPATPAASKVVIYAKSDGLMYSKDDAGTETLMSGGAGGGSVATDAIWDAAGDLAVGTGANTAARLAIGATNGMALQRVSGAVAWALPPGYEFDYVAKTTNTTINGTTEGGANTIVSGNAVTYDGSTVIIVEWWAPGAVMTTGTTDTLNILLYDGASLESYFTAPNTAVASRTTPALYGRRRLTPSAASHTFHVKGFVSANSATVYGGAGGGSAFAPGFIRITKA